MSRKFLSRKPYYQDDSDYTTNSPSYYDDLARKNKLIKHLAKKIWEYEQALNEAIDDMNEQLNMSLDEIEKTLNNYITVIDGKIEWLDHVIGEGFDDRIEDLLREWVADGTLNFIINEEIFNTKADKVDLDNLRLQVIKNTNTLISKEINVKYPPDHLDPAIGNGVNDDTDPIQNIINYLANDGGTVFFPDGNYKISQSIYVPSNVNLKGNGYNSVITKTNGGYFVRLEGDFTKEINTSVNLTSGDRTIKTTSNHGYNEGDLILIKSQRNALSLDASDEWRLGGATSGTSTAYYGEFFKVNIVEDERTFVTSNGLIYPDYLTHNINETDRNARERTTLQKMLPIENVVIEDLRFKGNAVGGVRIYRSYNVRTKNLIFEIEKNATTIFIEESFNCYDEGSKSYFDISNPPDQHYNRNAYKVTSSHSCGFIGTYCEHGTQPFDFNFRDFSIVSTLPSVDNVHTNFSTFNGITSHGGVYGASIINSKFYNCMNYGISSRSRNSLITGNIVHGGIEPTFGYGVAIYEGSACDSIVSDNQIIGFNKGVTIIDGSTKEKLFKWVGLQIVGNSFRNVNRCIYFDMNELNDYTGNRGVTISNNTVGMFSGQYAKFVILDKVNGINISDNVVNDPTKSANAGVYIKDSSSIVISNNLFNNLSTHLWIEPPTISGNLRIQFDSKYVYSQSNVRVPETGVSLTNIQAGSIFPLHDDEYSLGWSGARFKAIWSSSGGIQTSDERMKTGFKMIDDRVLKAWEKVDFYTFKMQKAVDEKGEEAREHFGFIAQDIIQAFESEGLNAFEYGIVCNDENDSLGIRYDECLVLETALLRKKLGELNDETN